MHEYESVLLSKAVIAKLIKLKIVAQHTDNPTINEVIQSMVSEFNILAESEVALIWNGFGYEMINRNRNDE
jgi:ABC-type methionine transport system ATPase subunit